VLARRLDVAHEVADVAEWAARVGREAPEMRGTADALADRLATAAEQLPAASEVPIHRDFHAGHVFAAADERGSSDRDGRPGRLVVLDLDEARMGDPALDVAHFTAYLDASPWPGAPAARAAFLDTYGPLAGPAAEARTAFFAAFTNMKIAKQLVTGRGPVLPAEGRARTDLLAAVLQRGLTCLDG
jgi:aminoglycoside phosphotransferase (APT) family kinase protein